MATLKNTPSSTNGSTILAAHARINSLYANAEAESGRDLQGEEEAEIEALTHGLMGATPENASEAAALYSVALDELEASAEGVGSFDGYAIHRALKASRQFLCAA